ncbi:conserved hypothetical protein [Neospora caninum Liverpool]|uniref:Uncharacterized protein n=1 Tax=Neospora caninum (strain Liverpool) TaxID=572307 RepID=F0VA16_NEOCL|nr:conserved hypothetical protein [Neospora caninum Liverpool]CBZ50505.1 conserved hypothetical protein [Neospora caninum Liverpool]CEL65115.1 TPA: hypothetical protein BN1204_009740 [Neospora caninum Liverpool]|eukprot:XP_003880538.1 conserved hypothetical protein [Neospora caninum Liverpool]
MKLLTPLLLSGLVVAVAAQDTLEHSNESAENVVPSVGSGGVEDSADDRELGKKSGGYLPVLPVKKAPAPKVTYLPAMKKQPQPVVYASSKKGGYLPRKLQDMETFDTDVIPIDEKLENVEPEKAADEESADDRELGGKKRGNNYIPVKMPAPKKVIAAPKKVAVPVYSGKKGYWNGGYYRRLSDEPATEGDLVEELEIVEPEKAADEESADDRELGGKKRGNNYIPVKMPAPKKVIAAPKKVAVPVYSGKKGYWNGGYYRRLSDEPATEGDLVEELEIVEPEKAADEESADDRELGGKKRGNNYIPVKMPAPKKVIAAPKKVAVPVYSGKKGYWNGGYYRRLSDEPATEGDLVEELEIAEPEEATDEESADDRELGKSLYGGYSYLPSSKKTVQPTYKTKRVVQRPKKVVESAPKKLVRSEPKKTVRTVSKKTVNPTPKKVIRSAPKKSVSYPMIQTQTKKGMHHAPQYTSKKGSY